jgi:hypothetical protein
MGTKKYRQKERSKQKSEYYQKLHYTYKNETRQINEMMREKNFHCFLPEQLCPLLQRGTHQHLMGNWVADRPTSR